MEELRSGCLSCYLKYDLRNGTKAKEGEEGEGMLGKINSMEVSPTRGSSMTSGNKSDKWDDVI